jgi:hypothetical protein
MSATGNDHDIDLVLVTGAGASCAFGYDGARLPLMGDWSKDLVGRLAERGGGYLAATGLSGEMDGPQFEDQLGRFLRAVAAFSTMEMLLEPMSDFPGLGAPIVGPGQWSEWHRQMSNHLAQITGVIHESLYALFASPTFDPRAAQQAYQTLFAELGTGPSARLVYATTNYDTIGEETMAALGWMPDAGDFEVTPFSAEREIRVDQLLGGMPRFTPVLHLHGRVGWFRRPDRGIVSIPGRGYNADTGVPIVMLPDLEKDYATDPVISTLWAQFADAVRRAKKVLVLGHSLHDEALITTLAENALPPTRVAVTFLASQMNPAEPDGEDAAGVLQRVRERLPSARAIPFRFDSATGQWRPELREWASEP